MSNLNCYRCACDPELLIPIMVPSGHLSAQVIACEICAVLSGAYCVSHRKQRLHYGRGHYACPECVDQLLVGSVIHFATGPYYRDHGRTVQEIQAAIGPEEFSWLLRWAEWVAGYDPEAASPESERIVRALIILAECLHQWPTPLCRLIMETKQIKRFI